MPDVDGRMSDSESGLASSPKDHGCTVSAAAEDQVKCAGCKTRIVDRYYLMAVDKKWHLNCLRCYECKVTLDSDLTCFFKDGNIYCREDYYRLFSLTKCGRCRQGIVASEMVMRVSAPPRHIHGGAMNTGGASDAMLVFHVACFTCTWCNTILSPGDHYGIKDDLVYCSSHYHYILLQGEYPGYGEIIPSPSIDANGHLNQNQHYFNSSARASPELGPTSPPRSHQTPPPYFHAAGGGANHHHQPSGVVSAVRKGRPRKRKVPPAIAQESSLQGMHDAHSQSAATPHSLSDDLTSALGLDGRRMDGNHLTQSERSLMGHQTPRAKRMRTSFKHHQLRTMKSYFSINQNPDAKDLKQLAQKTGLSKRVLQVWFQNARAKWRRNTLRQEGKNQDLLQSDGNSSTSPSLSDLTLPSNVSSGTSSSNGQHHQVDHSIDHMLASPGGQCVSSQQSSLHSLISESADEHSNFHEIF